MNIQKMLQQAQKMQARLQEEMERLEVEASAGGGMVTARMNGRKQLVALAVQPKAVDPDDVEMLQDLVLAAVNEAARRVDEALEAKMGSLGLPGFPGPT